MKAKLKGLWKWLRKNVFNKEMFIFVLIAEAIFWSPCIVTGLLALMVNKWYWTVFTAICVFWAGPFTPAVPLQLALALALKKLWHKLHNRKLKGSEHPQVLEGSSPSPITRTYESKFVSFVKGEQKTPLPERESVMDSYRIINHEKNLIIYTDKNHGFYAYEPGTQKEGMVELRLREEFARLELSIINKTICPGFEIEKVDE